MNVLFFCASAAVSLISMEKKTRQNRAKSVKIDTKLYEL